MYNTSGGYGGYGRPQIRFGGPLTPWVKILLIANLAMFAIVFLPRLAPGGEQLAAMINFYLGMTPALFWGNFSLWMPFTYMFVHAGFLHIGFNMLVLWMFGGDVEQVFGSKNFIVYYFICGAGAGLLVALLQPGSQVPTVGASGAIYGLILAFGLFFPERTLLIYGIFPVKAKFLVIILGAMTFFFSISASGGGISHIAHLGGMLFGFLYIKQNAIKRFFSSRKKRKPEKGKVYNIDELRRMFEDDDKDGKVH
jgi:membrane associated rhomboid family serine protease